MKHHWLDSSVLLSPDKSKPTCTGLFEVFGRQCSLSAGELKEQLIDWMCDNRVELANCMAIALNQSKQSFAEWMQKITLNNSFILDELTLYCCHALLGIMYLSTLTTSAGLHSINSGLAKMNCMNEVKLNYCMWDTICSSN